MSRPQESTSPTGEETQFDVWCSERDLIPMNINQVKRLVRKSWETRTPLVPLIWGEAGTGKTACVKQVARDLEYGYTNIPAGFVGEEDLKGVLSPNGENELVYKILLRPDFALPIQRVLAGHSKGHVFCLDEMNRLGPEAQRAAFALITERSLSGLSFADAPVFFAATANPDYGSYGVDALKNKAWIRRVLHVPAKEDVPTFLEYAKEERFSTYVIDYIINNPAELLMPAKEKAPYANPASWEKISEVIKTYDIDEMKNTGHCGFDLELEMTGILGHTLARNVLEFIINRSILVTAKDLLTLEWVDLLPILVEGQEQGKFSLLASLIDSLVLELYSNKPEPTERLAGRLIEFVMWLPNDYKHRWGMAFKRGCDNDPAKNRYHESVVSAIQSHPNKADFNEACRHVNELVFSSR